MNMPTESSPNVHTVYVVDDGADYRFLVQKVFNQFLPQYRVSLFPGGESLLNHLKTNPIRPALILLDLHMPGMSGLQTLRQLKQNPPRKRSSRNGRSAGAGGSAIAVDSGRGHNQFVVGSGDPGVLRSGGQFVSG